MSFMKLLFLVAKIRIVSERVTIITTMMIITTITTITTLTTIMIIISVQASVTTRGDTN